MTFQTWETPRSRSRLSAFDSLIGELRSAADERDRRRRRVATKRATASMLKSLAAATAELKSATVQKPMTSLLVAWANAHTRVSLAPSPHATAALAKILPNPPEKSRRAKYMHFPFLRR